MSAPIQIPPRPAHRTAFRGALSALLICALSLILLAPAAGAGQRAGVSCTGGTVVGSNNDDRLETSRSKHRIRGRAGNDRLRGRSAADCLWAGAGNDVIKAADGTRDLVSCGSGLDAAVLDRADVDRGCEQTRISVRRKPNPPTTTEPPPSSGDCPLAFMNVNLPSCSSLFRDSSAIVDPLGLWGAISCQEVTRHTMLLTGGDTHALAQGASQGNQSYRRMRLLDGDNSYGARCELGKNSRTSGPTALYHPDTRRITFISVRLGSSMDLSQSRWQAVMQMKQTAPADGQAGTPALELDAYSNRWHLRQSGALFGSSSGRTLWSAPASKETWTRFAFDITYSADPAKGKIKVYADLNGDGDAVDSGEQSPLISTATLKRETAGTTADGLAEGDAIPSHLRTGLYHDPNYVCPAPNGCEVGIDNVEVVVPPQGD